MVTSIVTENAAPVNEGGLTSAVRRENVPEALKGLNRWVAWRGIEKGKKADGRPKFDKIPYNAKTGAKASSTDGDDVGIL